MKKIIVYLLIMVAFLQGCASMKGSVLHSSKVSVKTESKVNSDSTLQSILTTNKELQTQLNTQKYLNEQKNVQSQVIEEDASVNEKGSSLILGTKGDSGTFISQIISRGRITAIGTYSYNDDSIFVELIVGDTIINIHRKTTTTTDKSNFKSEASVSSNIRKAESNSALIASESKIVSEIKSDEKVNTKTKASFSASIGISNWLPVIIALLIGLSAGIVLGRKSKK